MKKCVISENNVTRTKLVPADVAKIALVEFQDDALCLFPRLLTIIAFSQITYSSPYC